MNTVEVKKRESKPVRMQQVCMRLIAAVDRLEETIDLLDNCQKPDVDSPDEEHRNWSVVESLEIGADIIASRASEINELIDRLEEKLY